MPVAYLRHQGLFARCGPITRVGVDASAWNGLPARPVIDGQVVHLDSDPVGDDTVLIVTVDRPGSGCVVRWSEPLVVQVLFAQQVVLAAARGLLLAGLLSLLAGLPARLGLRGVSGAAMVFLRLAALARLLTLLLRTVHDADSS
ncbi:DUF5994 family protein [Streptomyces sp. NPDC058304]|uniref:DUF5994 family protein n=1 Tax=Streptomyces sp. NPDC058304 TaxID=3346437 RepID=UPI0036EDD5A6